MNNKITVVGSGYVGLSISVLLSQHNDVKILDIDKNKVNLINKKKSPIFDSEIENFLSSKTLSLYATSKKEIAYKDSKFIVIATPTDYDVETNYFDTSSVELVVQDAIEINPDATIIIKSTLPIGFTQKLNRKYSHTEIIFSPEFLREGSALYDNLYPSRIVMGSHSQDAITFANLLANSSNKPSSDISILYTDSSEAESIKLFSNSYLAMRVAFFNELDTFCEINNLNTKQIIDGVSLDTRIGSFYNNPSFGYGGYCLPKDTKQLLANFKTVPNKLITSIVEANEVRKDFISRSILNKNPQKVGVYRLIMKSGSDNFRSSAIQHIIKNLIDKDIEVIIYEPSMKDDTFLNAKVVLDLDYFKSSCQLIITNRMTEDLNDVQSKVFTRDIYGVN